MTTPAAETTALLARYPFPSRQRYEDGPAASGPSPAPHSAVLPSKAPGAGEELTHGQKVALLKARGSDWSKAVLAHLEAFGKADCGIADYRVLVAKGLAVSRGGFHTLTSHGRWRADIVASEFAKAEGMHVMTYNAGRRGPASKAASARCTCGWSSYASLNIASYMTPPHRHGRGHLEHVGQYMASEAV